MGNRHTSTRGGDLAAQSAARRIGSGNGQARSGDGARRADASAVSGECDLDAEVRQAASRYVELHGEWFHDQEGRQSDKKEMREVISDWEGQHGPLTPQEKAEARAVLGL